MDNLPARLTAEAELLHAAVIAHSERANYQTAGAWTEHGERLSELVHEAEANHLRDAALTAARSLLEASWIAFQAAAPDRYAMYLEAYHRSMGLEGTAN